MYICIYDNMRVYTCMTYLYEHVNIYAITSQHMASTCIPNLTTAYPTRPPQHHTQYTPPHPPQTGGQVLGVGGGGPTGAASGVCSLFQTQPGECIGRACVCVCGGGVCVWVGVCMCGLFGFKCPNRYLYIYLTHLPHLSPTLP